MKIKDPIIELLAIKLYEHDSQTGKFPELRQGWAMPSWMRLDEEDREIYRRLSSGLDDIPDKQ